jgi:hypothetical protein
MRRPWWVGGIIAAGVAAVAFLLWLSLSEGGSLRLVADDPKQSTTPFFEPSTVIRPTFKGGEPYCPPTRSNCCETWVTTYATEAPITEVVDFFEGIGFRVRGEPGIVDARGNVSPGSALVRWAGDRGAGVRGWRKVDISIGWIWGQPKWPTVVELFAPACRV